MNRMKAVTILWPASAALALASLVCPWKSVQLGMMSVATVGLVACMVLAISLSRGK